jgi:hypothetical protein
MSRITGYEADFYAWLNEQATLLRAGRLASIDAENIAEELESMGRSEKRELISRLQVLLLHLLKWQFQPERRGVSWEVSITNTRRQLSDHLADNPSLKARKSEFIEITYPRARDDARAETNLPPTTFPTTCPWPWDQIIDEGFWPE